MRKSMICAVAVATAAVPAGAIAKPKPKPTKPTKPYCVPQNVGYEATGSFVTASVTQSAGADTAKRSDDRYSGTATINITKANHGAPKGEQTVTLTNAKVKFHPRNDTDVQPGDRVKFSGKVTKFGKKCANPGPTVLTVKKADVKAKKA